jgi:hypothetical protein
VISWSRPTGGTRNCTAGKGLDQLRVARLLLDYFDELGVVAVLGGSMASSLIGEPRATNDVDLAAALSHDTARRLVGKLGEAFYADLSAIEEAVTHCSSFNVIHLATATKVDIFVLGDGLLDRRQAHRRVRIEVADEHKTVLWVSSPEDQVLRKLAWYRLGQEVSDRQWRDIRAMLQVQQGNLDRADLEQAAVELGLLDLLHRAIREAGIAESGTT